MSEPPLSVVNLHEAGIIRISPETVAPDAPHLLERLHSLLPENADNIHLFTDKGAPPWDQPEIVDVIKARAWRQFIILSDVTSSFIVTLAMMALEQGYDVYVVCDRCVEDDEFSISRLEKAGATFMLFDRFLEECSYRSDAGSQ